MEIIVAKALTWKGQISLTMINRWISMKKEKDAFLSRTEQEEKVCFQWR